MNKLEQHRDEYNFALNQIPKLDVFIENDFVQNYVHEITKSYNDLFNIQVCFTNNFFEYTE